ncbi:MAG TPA: MlaD family protein [Stellaceae bacterium]|nr:MlaD family protein [Stellaceae bacterium]
METRAHYVAVGAFVLAMVFLAFVAVVWLAGSQITASFNHFYIYFEGPVSGLSVGGRVEYNGIPVGTVSDIEIVSNPETLAANGGKPIRVTIEIKSSVEIKRDAAASIQTNILSGVSFILISPGRSQELLEAHKGERYPVIRSRRSTLSSLAARGPQLLDKLDVILDHVDDVLNDHNREALAATLDNVRKVTGALAEHGDEIAADAQDALKSAASLFGNLDKSYTEPNGLKDRLASTLTDLSVSLKDFDKLANGLSDTNRQIQLTMQDVRPAVHTFSQRTLGDVDALIGEARQFIAGLGRLVAQIEHDPTRLLFGDRREGYQPK